MASWYIDYTHNDTLTLAKFSYKVIVIETLLHDNVPYSLKLRPVSYKRRVSINGLGIARYNIINRIAIALHESLASIRIHC